MPWYKAGTVTLTTGSAEVVGSGTTWGDGAITPGDSFSLVDASGAAVEPFYEVAEVTDDTHLTLTAPYGGSSASGVKYALWNLAAEHTTPYLSALVAALVQKFKTVSTDILNYYTERDLTTVFASEISGYSDVWAWIKARITAVNWDGLMIGDYIPFQMNGQTVKAQIAGIDTYYGVMDQPVGHHIDFISRDCFNSTMKWNTTNTNQGTASENSPWLASNAYSVLNTTWYNYLPAALKSVIVEKRFLIETRYSSSGPLTASNSWKWANIGKLWLPSVYEIFGSNVWGTQGYSEGNAVQYPIFANSWQYRRKGAGNGGGRCDWWTLTPSGVSSAAVCHVYGGGGVYSTGAADYEFREPVCFRIS